MYTFSRSCIYTRCYRRYICDIMLTTTKLLLILLIIHFPLNIARYLHSRLIFIFLHFNIYLLLFWVSYCSIIFRHIFREYICRIKVHSFFLFTLFHSITKGLLSVGWLVCRLVAVLVDWFSSLSCMVISSLSVERRV